MLKFLQPLLSKAKIEIAHRLGADVAINYKEESVQEYVQKHTNGNGFEVIFDTVGGKNLDNSFEAAAINGTVVTIAARSTHDLSPLHAKGTLSARYFYGVKNITYR